MGLCLWRSVRGSAAVATTFLVASACVGSGVAEDGGPPGGASAHGNTASSGGGAGSTSGGTASSSGGGSSGGRDGGSTVTRDAGTAPHVPPQARLRRLLGYQYRNAVRQLLGESAAQAATPP